MSPAGLRPLGGKFFFPWAKFWRWRNFHTWKSAYSEILYFQIYSFYLVLTMNLIKNILIVKIVCCIKIQCTWILRKLKQLEFWWFFKRDLARALLRIWFVLVLVSPKSQKLHHFKSKLPKINTYSEPPNHTSPKNSNRIIKEFPNNSDRIPKQFQKKIIKNSQRIPKQFPKKP